MDEEMETKISDVVLDILSTADMEKATEFKVRTAAAERLGIDLSHPDRKRFVRSVVESFLKSKQAEAETVQEGGEEESGQQGDDQEEEDAGGNRGEKEFDDDGDLIVCRLSNKRRVTLQEFRGKTLVSIREFFEKDGKQFPTSKGISLSIDQWEAFRNLVPEIEDAINKLESGED
ncbi:putative RNA polymerase II transcriptional coactivator KELP protein [Dioscorea alata]|uniref:RNA polymerase II transcriptional coactivator KELP protein n=1 Tax=Dioscorea alata TaxID=55571 RepID=A0ACB7W3U5_DIOAL|nr:putative RNA polymerase II transcriptional coactivator KELP protein [Dioscorea alata]